MMLVACAIVHGKPPEVFLADDIETLNWVLAIRLVAQSRARDFSPSVRDALRAALLEERWGDALMDWISASGQAVDVYPSFEVYGAEQLTAELGAAELQFTPLFRDESAG